MIINRRNFLNSTSAAALGGLYWELNLMRPAQAQTASPDVIIVGTGFGAAVAAQQLIQAKKKVLMLERGVFYLSPDKLGVAPASSQLQFLIKNGYPVELWARPDHRSGLIDLFRKLRQLGSVLKSPRGLYQYSMFKDAHVLTASGVGGGSLIYSNVNLRPPSDDILRGLRLHPSQNVDPKTGEANFDYYPLAESWMIDHRGPLNRIVTKSPVPQNTDFVKLANDVDSTLPDGRKHFGRSYLLLDRSRELYNAAGTVCRTLGIPNNWEPLKLSIDEYDPTSDQDPKSASGVDSAAFADKDHTYCQRQGRCILGCLPQARHTFNKMYFKIWQTADADKLTIKPLSEVKTFQRQGNEWAVYYRDWADRGKVKLVSAPQLILAAGSLGTTEIMLRSKSSVSMSPTLGSKFSTNGDFGAFVHNTTRAVNSTVGPINTCHVPMAVSGLNITVEDCAIPSMLASTVATVIRIVKNAADFDSLMHAWVKAWRHRVAAIFFNRRPLSVEEFPPDTPEAQMDGFNPPEPGAEATEAELVSNTFFFNIMGEDHANGQFKLVGSGAQSWDDPGELQRDRLDLTWPADDPIANQPVYVIIEDIVKRFAAALAGHAENYVPFPLWSRKNRKVIVTHPLGGCPIGTTRDDGTVDEFGRVFDASPSAQDKTTTHTGLYVIDGSVLPRSVAANPTLTIVAQALKSMSKIV